jgi:hypothetical protein
MKQRSTYQKPTVKVVGLETGKALLEGSPVNTTLGGYQYKDNVWLDE